MNNKSFQENLERDFPEIFEEIKKQAYYLWLDNGKKEGLSDTYFFLAINNWRYGFVNNPKFIKLQKSTSSNVKKTENWEKFNNRLK